MLETSWYILQHRNKRLLPVVAVDEVADQDVKKDDEDCSKGVDEEEQLGLGRELLCKEAAEPSNEV